MKASEILREGKRRIEELGWWRGRTGTLPNKHFPVGEDNKYDCYCLAQSVDFSPAAERYIRRVLLIDPQLGETEGEYEIFRINDSQPDETGPQWAVDIMAKAIEIAESEED